MQKLLREKPRCSEKLSELTSACECLQPQLTQDGREQVRRQVDSVSEQWRDTLDAMQQSQRAVEVSLVQWTSFEESHEQVRAWMDKIEAQVLREWPLVASLDEKIAQLSVFKVKK